MDDYSFGIALGQKLRAEGAERGMASALAACETYKQRLHSLEVALAASAAHAEGLHAQLEAFKKQHAQSPLLAKTGKRFRKSGMPKTNGRLIYEAAFDRIAKERQITPLDHRTD